MGSHDTELAAYQPLHRLQCRYILCLLGVVRLCITPELTPLHPITNIVHGSVLDCIPGVSMEKLKLSIDVSEQEVARISSDVMAGLCAIEALAAQRHPHQERRSVGKGSVSRHY